MCDHWDALSDGTECESTPSTTALGIQGQGQRPHTKIIFLGHEQDGIGENWQENGTDDIHISGGRILISSNDLAGSDSGGNLVIEVLSDDVTFSQV